MDDGTIDSPMKYERETNLIVDYIGNFENINILDLGCGEGYMISCLYNKLHLKIQSIIGVDDNKEGRLRKVGDFIDFHNNFDEIVHMPRNYDRIKLLQQKAINYLKENSSLQDIVLMSNSLHYSCFKEKIGIINLTLERLSERGIIYIKVGNESHGDVDFPMKKEDWIIIKRNEKVKVLYEAELPGGFLEAILKSS